jgi:hypothetical protein
MAMVDGEYCILREETVRERRGSYSGFCCRLYPFICWIIIKQGPGNFSGGCSPHWTPSPQAKVHAGSFKFFPLSLLDSCIFPWESLHTHKWVYSIGPSELCLRDQTPTLTPQPTNKCDWDFFPFRDPDFTISET